MCTGTGFETAAGAAFELCVLSTDSFVVAFEGASAFLCGDTFRSGVFFTATFLFTFLTGLRTGFITGLGTGGLRITRGAGAR